MIFKTRLTNFIFNNNLLSSHKYKLSINKSVRILCLLLIGFLVGNLFGTFLSTIRKYVMWDGFIIFFLIIFIEILNYKVYHNKQRVFLFFIHPQRVFLTFNLATVHRPQSLSILQKRSLYPCDDKKNEVFCKIHKQSTNFASKRFFWTFLNFFKIGLMIGFFVDAFKVGS